MEPIRFTLITSTSCELAKSYVLKDGKPTGSAIAHMTSGLAKVMTVPNLPELRDVLELLTAQQAITAGVPNVGDSPLTTRRGSEFNPDAVARTNETFRYLDSPSLFVIDVDTEAGIYRTVGEVMERAGSRLTVAAPSTTRRPAVCLVLRWRQGPARRTHLSRGDARHRHPSARRTIADRSVG